jgi:rhodanese-related sulfurtransferase
VTRPTIADAPRTAQGFYEARPGDIEDRTDLFLIDVREESELLDALGHIHRIRHVPLARLLADGLPDVAPETPIVLMCKAGARSAKAAASLVARGFAEVYSVTGGMIRWNAEERPVARTRTWT